MTSKGRGGLGAALPAAGWLQLDAAGRWQQGRQGAVLAPPSNLPPSTPTAPACAPAQTGPARRRPLLVDRGGGGHAARVSTLGVDGARGARCSAVLGPRKHPAASPVARCIEHTSPTRTCVTHQDVERAKPDSRLCVANPPTHTGTCCTPPARTCVVHQHVERPKVERIVQVVSGRTLRHGVERAAGEASGGGGAGRGGVGRRGSMEQAAGRAGRCSTAPGGQSTPQGSAP